MHSKQKNKKQLGIDPGTASHRLKKSILFSFAYKLGFNWCYQCGTEIKDIDKPKENNPPEIDPAAMMGGMM